MTVSAFKAVGTTRFQEIRALEIDPIDGQALQEASKRCVKFEVKDPKHFIYVNPFVATKSMLENFSIDEHVQDMMDTLKGHTDLTLEILNRFRFELQDMVGKTEDGQHLLLLNNGYFEYASSQDKILKNGLITDLKPGL